MASEKKKSASRSHKKRTPAAGRRGSRARESKLDILEAINLLKTNAPDNSSAFVELAEQCQKQGALEKIVTVLEAIGENPTFRSDDEKDRYARLWILGLCHQGRLVEAEQAIQEYLAKKPDSLDALYAAVYVHMSFQEHVRAVGAGERYLNMRESGDKATTDSDEYSVTPAHESQLRNMLAAAYRETMKFEKADEQFRLSILADRTNHLPYLNLANMYVQLHRHFDALAAVESGLKVCSQVQELRILRKALQERPSISACMIVKDEEELLGDCLGSIRDWVDEIVVVDTGSADRTVEIAESYGAKLFHQPWEGDFSKHRNFSLEQATRDWVLIIDADERVVPEDVPILLDTLKRTDRNVISVDIVNVYPNHNRTTFLPSVRLFKRELGLRYDGIVHNVLAVPEDEVVARLGVKIRHLGYGLSAEKMAQKAERSRALLEKQLDENPDNAFALFNLAQLYRGQEIGRPGEHAEKIIDLAERAVKLTDPLKPDQRHIHLMCLDQAAWANLNLKRYDESLRLAQRALELKPNYLDPLLLLGHLYSQTGRLEEAETAFLRYLQVQADYNPSTETDNLIVNQMDARAIAHYGIAVTAELRRDFPTATRHYEATLNIDETYLQANGRLGLLLLQNGDVARAEEHLSRQIGASAAGPDILAALCGIYRSTGRQELARNILSQWLSQQPGDLQALALSAELDLDAGQPTKALESIERMLESSATNRNNLREIAGLLFWAEQYDRALGIYKELAADTADGGLLNDLANCLFKLNRLEEAAEQYVRATRTETVPVTAWRNLAITQARLNQYDEAIATLESYLERQDNDFDMIDLLGGLYCREGKYDRAIDLYERCLTVDPSSLSALVGLSGCYLALGHRDSALLGARRALAVDPNNKSAQELMFQIETSGASV